MCLAAFVVKYVLFFANVVFSLAGLGLIGVGIAVLVQFSDLVELVPVAIEVIPIAVIVVGSVVFFISLFGCCGAIKESRCLLIMYSVSMLILAAAKIYLAVVIFQSLSDIYNVVEGWIVDAFNNTNLREPFHVVEAAFKCCGVSGPGSYDGVYPALPPTCCANPADSGAGVSTCAADDAYSGCANIVADWFTVFGDAVGIVLITVIVVEIALFLGVNGTCRSIALTNITDDIEHMEKPMILKLRDTKTKLDRVFVIRGDNLEVMKEYEAPRPLNTTQPIADLDSQDKHKISSMSTEKANLAEGYIEDSIRHKTEITKVNNYQVKKETLVDNHNLGNSLAGVTATITTLDDGEAQVVLSQIHTPLFNQQSILHPEMASQINIQQDSNVSNLRAGVVTINIINSPNMSHVVFNIS